MSSSYFMHPWRAGWKSEGRTGKWVLHLYVALTVLLPDCCLAFYITARKESGKILSWNSSNQEEQSLDTIFKKNSIDPRGSCHLWCWVVLWQEEHLPFSGVAPAGARGWPGKWRYQSWRSTEVRKEPFQQSFMLDEEMKCCWWAEWFSVGRQCQWGNGVFLNRN